jgi:hypothetical protein
VRLHYQGARSGGGFIFCSPRKLLDSSLQHGILKQCTFRRGQRSQVSCPAKVSLGPERRQKIVALLFWIRVARFSLVQTYQNGKNIPNDHKLYQTAIHYSICHKIFQMIIKCNNIFHSKALQNLPKLGLLVWKQTIWQPCFGT